MYSISFQQIHYFLTLAEKLSFTAAAKSLFISQPALSKQIHVLEDELGFTLFIRNKRSVTLTPEGESLYKDWQNLEKALNTSIYNAKSIKKNTTGSLKIGCVDTFIIDSLSMLLNNYQEHYPNIEIELISYGFRTLRDQFKNGNIDIIFIPEFECTHFQNYSIRKFQEMKLCLAIPANHPLSKKESINIDDFKSESFIAISPKESEEGSKKVLKYLTKYGLENNTIKYASNLSSMLLAVKNGLGITICDNLIYDPGIKTFTLPDQPHDSDIMAVWNPDSYNTELDLFLNEMKSF